MGKKTVGHHQAKPAFRESDFAGKPAQEQAELSGSLNHLSLQLAATRKMLKDIEDVTTTPPQNQSSDDDTAVPR